MGNRRAARGDSHVRDIFKWSRAKTITNSGQGKHRWSYGMNRMAQASVAEAVTVVSFTSPTPNVVSKSMLLP